MWNGLLAVTVYLHTWPCSFGEPRAHTNPASSSFPGKQSLFFILPAIKSNCVIKFDIIHHLPSHGTLVKNSAKFGVDKRRARSYTIFGWRRNWRPAPYFACHFLLCVFVAMPKIDVDSGSESQSDRNEVAWNMNVSQKLCYARHHSAHTQSLSKFNFVCSLNLSKQQNMPRTNKRSMLNK